MARLYDTGASAQPGGRSDAYYVQARPEVADLVPLECRRVLEVGRGAFGEMGRLLKACGHYCYWRRVSTRSCRSDARRHLDEVVTADVETDDLPFTPWIV